MVGKSRVPKEDAYKILKAKPLDEEPDRAFVKWPRKKRMFKIRRKTVPTQKHLHPGTSEARKTLTIYGRKLDTCEECGKSNVRINIHHIDQNPYNNRIENLRVLCGRCHRKTHLIDPGIVDEFSEISNEYGNIPAEEYKESELKATILVQEGELPIETSSDMRELKGVVSPEEFKSSKFYGLQCRLCAHYRAFKDRCDITNEATSAYTQVCSFFEDRP